MRSPGDQTSGKKIVGCNPSAVVLKLSNSTKKKKQRDNQKKSGHVTVKGDSFDGNSSDNTQSNNSSSSSSNPGSSSSSSSNNNNNNKNRRSSSRQGRVLREAPVFQKIRDAQCSEFFCIGYERDARRATWTNIAIIFTLGILRLIFHWEPYKYLRCTHRRCRLSRATTVVIVDKYDQIFMERVKMATLKNIRLRRFFRRSIESRKALKSELGQITHLEIMESKGVLRPVQQVRYFINKKLRYVWDTKLQRFRHLHGLDHNVECLHLQRAQPLTLKDSVVRRVLYGNNVLLVGAKTKSAILRAELTEYVYVLQVLAIFYWFASEGYFYYPLSLGILLICSLITDIKEVYSNQAQLEKAAGLTGQHALVSVKRSNDSGVFIDKVPSEELVPGEVIVLPQHECQMVADAVIIQGSCVVNEATLTGECIPVVKTSIKTFGARNLIYNSERHSKCTLLSGTYIMQTRSSMNVEAVVIRTGFSTERGKHLGAMLFPKPVDFRLARDVDDLLKFLAPIAALAFLGLMTYKRIFQSNYFIFDFKTSFDIITLAMPPGLPTAMSFAGRVPAQQRLTQANVFCTSPRHISIGGSITCFCFDKTGTLTESDIDLLCVQCFDRPKPIKDPSTLPFDHPMRVAMACCHALTRAYDKFLGDPMDVKIFQAARFVFDDCNLYSQYGHYANERVIVRPMFQEVPNQHATTDGGVNAELPDVLQTSRRPFEVGILFVYPFASALQRMSVLTKVDNKPNLTVYTKGSPEIVATLCVKASIPEDYMNKLAAFTGEGHRVLAVATKEIPKDIDEQNLRSFSRQDVESELTMLGFIVMENRTRKQTMPVLKTLIEANIRPIMVTGDNLLTALAVARGCGLVEPTEPVIYIEVDESGSDVYWQYNGARGHVETIDNDELRITCAGNVKIATTGNVLSIIHQRYPKILRKVIVRGSIFARMTPDLKTRFVEHLQAVGHCVGFCGDGLNDCGALRAADIGIALLGSEASIYSPFTSTSTDISCIPKLISECRAALVTSCAVLRFMVCYACLQGTAIVIVEIVGVQYTDLEFLFIDIGLTMGTMALFGLTHPSLKLAKKPPAKSAMGLVPLISILVHTIISILSQIICVFFVWGEDDWYVVHPRQPMESAFKTEDRVNLTSVSMLYDSSERLEEIESPKQLRHYIVFVVNVFQYIALAVGFSVGSPHRQALITNHYLVAYLMGLVLVCTYLALEGAGYLLNFDYLPMKPTGRLFLVILGYCQVAFAYFIEKLIVNNLSTIVDNRNSRLHPPEYIRLDREIQSQDPVSWLPKYRATLDEAEASLQQIVELPSGQDHSFSTGPSVVNTINP